MIRQTGTHEPGFGTDPADLAAIAARGVEQPGPVDLHLQTAAGSGSSGSNRESTPTHQGAAVRDRFDPAADAKPGVVGQIRPAGDGASLVAQSRTTPLAGRARPAQRSVGRCPASWCPAPSTAASGRYAWWLLVPFVVAALLAGGGHPLGHRPPRIGTPGPGHPPRPRRRPRRPDRGRAGGVAWWCWRVGPRPRAVEPADVVDPRRWQPSRSVQAPRPRPTTRPATPGDGWSGRGYAGLVTAATFQSELTHLGVGFYANVGATAEVVEEHRGRLGLPPVFLHEPAGQLGRARDRGRAARPPAAGAERAPLAQRPRAGRHAGTQRATEPAPHAGGLVPRWATRGRRHPTSARPTAGPGGCDAGPRPPSSSPASSTCSTPSPRRCGAGSTSSSSSSPCGPARRREPSSPWPVLALVALGRGILRGQRRAWRVAVVLLVRDHRPAPGGRADFEESLVALAVLDPAAGQPARLPGGFGLVLTPLGPLALGVAVVGITLLTTGVDRAVHPRRAPSPHPHPLVDRAGGRCPNGWSGIQTVAAPPPRRPIPRAPRCWPSA